MRISFVSPLNLSGGCLVVALYAQALRDRAHEVTICCSLKEALLRPRSHYDGRKLKIRPYVPDGDVVIATWWRTAKIVYGLPERKGAKAYFIQHHEVHEYLPADEARASYRLPLHKIVVAQWLKDVMQHGAGFWQVQITVAMGNAVDNDAMLLQPYEILEVLDTLAELFDRGREIGFRILPGNNIGYFGPHESMIDLLTVHRDQAATARDDSRRVRGPHSTSRFRFSASHSHDCAHTRGRAAALRRTPSR